MASTTKYATVIPAAQKDFEILGRTIQSLRNYVPQVGPIYVISHFEPGLGETDWIPEEVYFGDCHPQTLTVMYPHLASKASWFTQQLIKLYAIHRVRQLLLEDAFFICDADLIWLREVPLTNGEGKVFIDSYPRVRSEAHPAIHSITGCSHRVPGALSHHALWRKTWIEKARHLAWERGFGSWIETLRAVISPTVPWCAYSEYNLMANVAVTHFRDEVEVRDLMWTGLSRVPDDRDERELADTYDFAVLHSFLRSSPNGLNIPFA